nr:MAG TPA: hypothetical protein [Caudoviricetes sp.]
MFLFYIPILYTYIINVYINYAIVNIKLIHDFIKICVFYENKYTFLHF